MKYLAGVLAGVVLVNGFQYLRDRIMFRRLCVNLGIHIPVKFLYPDYWVCVCGMRSKRMFWFDKVMFTHSLSYPREIFDEVVRFCA